MSAVRPSRSNARRGYAPLALVLFAAGFLGAGGPAAAASAEALVGAYVPGPGFLGTDPMAGIRFGFPFTPKFGVEAEFSFVGADGEIDDDSSPGGTIRVDLDAVNIDLSVVWNLHSGGKAAPLVFTGFGYANVTGEVSGSSSSSTSSTLDQSGLRDDSFTLHAGVAYRQEISPLVYFRLDVRARWFAERDQDEIDAQATVGVGFLF